MSSIRTSTTPGTRTRRPRRSSPPSPPPPPPTSTPPSPGPPPPSAAGPPLAPADRARLLRRFAAVVDEHLEELARLEVREAGHTIGNARWEAGNVRDLLDYAAGGVERLTGRQIPVAGGLDVTFLEPLGVVGVIAPWNFPMPIAAWGTAPALAAGNAVLLKPAETTPLTALRLAELALEAGLPEGLFQVLPGARRRSRATRSSSTPASRRSSSPAPPGVGKQIMAKCADQREARHPRTRRQEPQHRLRRRRPRGRRRRRPHVLPRQHRPGLLRPHPHPRPALRRTTASWSSSPPPIESVVVGDPADEKTADGPADLPAPSWTASARTSPTTLAGIRGNAPEGPGFWFPPTVLTGVGPGRAARPSRRSSARSPSSCPSRTRPTRSGSPTPPTTASPAPSGPATSAAPCASPAPSAPATCPSTPTPASATGPRSAATSSPASAANSAPTP